MVSYVMRTGSSKVFPGRAGPQLHDVPRAPPGVDRGPHQQPAERGQVGRRRRAGSSGGVSPTRGSPSAPAPTRRGERKNYLKERDEAVVIVYDDAKFPNGPDAAQVEALFHDKTAADGIVCVHQTFV